MSIPPEIKWKADELARQRQLDGDEQCPGCEGYGTLMISVSGQRAGFVTCGGCGGTGSKRRIPYACEGCGEEGVKLWREFQTFADEQTLLCARCAGERESKDVMGIDDDGMIPGYFARTDQIGFMVPAIPTETGTFWGYTSVPDVHLRWWRSLPSLAEPCEGC
jgi:hypothetical protein